MKKRPVNSTDFLISTRRTVMTGWLTCVLAAAILLPATLWGQGAPPAPQTEPTLTVTGTVKCSSCDLKKQKGAKAQCSVYGCQHSFKAESVTDERGKRVKSYEGKTYHILLNDQSKALAQKEQKGKRFNLKAKIHAADGMIEVQSFAATTP